MRYEGTVKIMGLLQVVVDDPGLSVDDARRRVEKDPERYKVDFVESMFETWEEDLTKTEDDEPDEEDDGEGEEES